MSEEKQMVEGFESPVNLKYSFAAGAATSKFLREIRQGRIVGQRSEATGFVSVPPRGACPISGTPTTEEVQLPETGTVMSFTIVHIPIPNAPVKPPFIVANIVLDESDQTFIHLVSECDNEKLQIGERVKAVWKDESDWDLTLENIKYFVPTGEDAIDIKELKAKRMAETEKYRNA
ncbi:Uncharacterised protein [BD1-7 clade bacterium]|uniref:DUF35 domain-containing protein n=1 Tax=BD1-7 clade bacterium TaxID=2029982 RepID=A0A5S9QL58_9GAMM|nr:Uncharacterised protein [BD1-7 clade bacterium]CAA0119042.1 Uncharacterised protein [BD1-7 clade bacterium]CAA0120504.1 Uncharacterised protein [BD1-7 clade bacterium]